jgi:hypothetical protein
LLAVAAYAKADDEKSLVQILTCNLQGDRHSIYDSWKILEPRATKLGDGSYKIAGRFRFGDVCIENAQVAAAFGVFTTIASLCNGDPKSFIDFLKTTESNPAPRATPPVPGMVAAFEAPKYMLTLFHGEPALEAKPDPASKRLVYLCAHQFSGAQ